MSRDLKLVYKIVLLVVLLAEALALTGLVRAPHAVLVAKSTGDVAHLGTYTLHFFLLYLFSRPSWHEVRNVLIGGTALAVLGAFTLDRPWPTYPYWYWLFVASAGCGSAALAALMVRIRRRIGDLQLAKDLLAAWGLVLLADPSFTSYRDLSAALHPATFDLALFRFDATLGFQPAATLALIADQAPWLSEVMTAAYLSLPYGLSSLYAMQRANPGRLPVNILMLQAISALIALSLYHLYPVVGPKYAFGAAFPAYLPTLDEVTSAASVVSPAPRNGMPSMHLGWALALWLNAGFLGMKWVRVLFAVVLGLTALATLGLGEHYLIDLVVVVPLMVGIQALCSRGLPWSNSERRSAAAYGFALTFAWILALRFGVETFTVIPGLSWAAMAATVVVSIWLYRPLARACVAMRDAGALAVAEEIAVKPPSASSNEVRYVAAMFVISGFAGLMYQVLFSKALALTFGSTSTATYTVLATYMGGMAIGAWLGGKLAARYAEPLKLYAWCELGIGVFCIATPLLFQGIQAVYVALAAGVAPDVGALTLFRVVLGAGVLTLPTVLMGMTLPILARFFEQRAQTLGRSVALLYGANTLGAALGALLAGYLVIPALGVVGTTLLAAFANLIAVWLALRLAQRQRSEPLAVAGQPMHASNLDGTQERRLGTVALAILGVGGIVTLALEVVYIHLLAVVAGNSVYAFSLMLFAFLLGLGAGAEGARHLLKLRVSLPRSLAWLEFALAAVILLGVYQWASLPEYFASFAQYPITRGFGAREVVRGLVCFVAMFPPALLIGALYPLAMECVGRAYAGAPIAALGRAAAINTAGNIVGVLAAGFWLLPAIGALRSIQLLAALCLALGTMAIVCTSLRTRPFAWTPAALVLVLLVAQPRSFDYTALASGANVYFARQGYGQVIDQAESVDGGLTTVAMNKAADGMRVLTLLTNGKFQGSNALEGEMKAQIGFALSPLLHTLHRERALVIGFGTGASARTLHAAGFKALDVVDLSADIIRLATEHFANVNDRVTTKPGVNTYVTDGRNFLLLQERKYDVVSMEVTSIWFAGAASLYSREFYQLVKLRLAPHGVLQQWIQLHHLEPTDILYILGSLRSEFDHVWLYLIGGQGMLIATNDPGGQPTEANAAKLDATPGLKALLAPQEGRSAKALLETRLLDPAGTDRFLGSFDAPASFWVSTDDNLRLEYSTPKGNALGGAESFKQNLELIQRYTAATPRPE